MSRLQKPLKEKVEEIARKYQISPAKVEEIEQTVWEFVRSEISKGEGDDPNTYENILLKYLGTLHIQKRKMEYYNKLKHDK